MIDYKEFALDFLTAMKEGNFPVMEEMPKKLETPEAKAEALSALLELIDKEDDKFKEDNKKIIDSLNVAKVMQETAEAEKTDDSAEGDTSEAVAEVKEPAVVSEPEVVE